MSARRDHRSHIIAQTVPCLALRPSRRVLLTLVWLAGAVLFGAAVSRLSFGRGASHVGVAGTASQAGEDTGGPRQTAHTPSSIHELLALPDDQFEKLDIVELNLAVAREIPECRGLDVARYQRTVDEWAARVKHEIDRHMYRFEQDPGNYKNSRAYFCALMMCTVIGKDYGVHYDLEDFSFEQPEDQFIHGVIDRRKGTCVSLPLIYIAIGQRLGYPIRGITESCG